MAKQRRKPHRYKKRKPIYKNRFFWLIILIFLFFSSLSYFLFFSDFFRIKKIEISGLEQIEKNDIYPLISSGNIFLINLDRTKKDILEKFPEISKIEMRRRFPDGLNISITERKELAVFCFYDQKEDCFILDKDGVIFEIKQETDSLMKIIDKREAGPPVLGKKVIEKQDIVLLLEINSYLKENLKIKAKDFILFSEGLTILTQADWEIYFNIYGDVDWQLTKLRVLLEEKITEERRENLEYIELRFGDFANPKYKD